MMLSFFEDEASDLDELFDMIAHNPKEFRRWLVMSAARIGSSDKATTFLADVAVAMYAYFAKNYDDEFMEDLNAAIADVITKDRRKLLVRRRIPTAELDCSTPFNFFAHCAADEDYDAQHRNNR